MLLTGSHLWLKTREIRPISRFLSEVLKSTNSACLCLRSVSMRLPCGTQLLSNKSKNNIFLRHNTCIWIVVNDTFFVYCTLCTLCQGELTWTRPLMKCVLLVCNVGLYWINIILDIAWYIHFIVLLFFGGVFWGGVFVYYCKEIHICAQQ